MASSSPKMCIVSYIDLPLQTIEHSKGLGIDIGGSAIKVVYRPKQNSPREGEPPIAEGKERLRLSVYPRADLDKALKEIADHADIRRKDDKDIPTIYAAGIGSNEMKTKLMDRLQIDTKNLVEFDVFVKCFKKLTSILPHGDLIDPLHEKGANDGKKILESLFKTVQENQHYFEGDVSGLMGTNIAEEKEQELSNEVPYAQADKDLFPCHIAMLGSGIGILQVNEDETFSILDMINRGGASFVGLGNIVAGTNSFEELISLAEAGSDHDVSLYTGDIAVDANADDMYGMAAKVASMLSFSFGKARDKNKDSISKESLVRALVVQHATDICTFVHLRALVHDVTNVFFAGSFANADVIREEISRYSIVRMMNSPPGKKAIRYHFLKHGGFYGALGAFLHQDRQELESTK